MMPLPELMLVVLLICMASAGLADAPDGTPPGYCRWQAVDYGIDAPLCGLTGDAQRGRDIVSDRARGNCLACHRLPVEGIESFGNIGPPLDGIAARLPVPMLRLRVVDTRSINPASIMPGFYRDPRLINRPGRNYAGKTFLTAQEVEDVIAWLATLR